MAKSGFQSSTLKPATLLLVVGTSVLVMALIASFISLMTVTYELNSTLRLPLEGGGYIDQLFNANGRIVNGSLTITSDADGTVLIALGTFTKPKAYALGPMEEITVSIGPGYRIDVLKSNATSGYLVLSLEGLVERRPYPWASYLGLLLFLVGTITSTIGLMMLVGLVKIGGGEGSDEGGRI